MGETHVVAQFMGECITRPIGVIRIEKDDAERPG